MSQRRPFSSRYGPWAVVAGASEGLGAAFARILASRGLNLVLVGRRTALIETLAGDLSARHRIEARAVTADLASDDAVRLIARDTPDINIGLLVYNAAYSTIGPFLNHDAEHHIRVLDVNCKGPVLLVRHFADRMRMQGGGGIILMSSLAAFHGSPMIATYAASKSFNVVLAEALNDELRVHNIDVLACCAGATRTPGLASTHPRSVGGWAPEVMDPDDVANQALDALGHKPLVVTGAGNRLGYFVMNRLLPRRLVVSVMGRRLRQMYGDDWRQVDDEDRADGTPTDSVSEASAYADY